MVREMVTTVTMSSEAYAEILARAAADPAHEVCGLLLGTTDTIVELVACANVAADPAIRFEIDPAMLLAAHRAARQGGRAVIGCYHSHPTGRAEPSSRDAADAAPDGGLWLIAAGGALTAWRAVPRGALHGRFDRAALHCVPQRAITGAINEGPS